MELGTQVASLEWLTTCEMMACYFRSNREVPRGPRTWWLSLVNLRTRRVVGAIRVMKQPTKY